jgi:hypothetical protein
MSSTYPNVSPLPVDVESLPPVDAVREGGGDVTLLSGWADEGRRLLVDTAAAKLNMKRAHFVVEAATEKAIRVLQEAA